MAEQQVTMKRGRGDRGPSPLSATTRRRLLAGLLQRAEAGDADAAAALIRLGMLKDRATSPLSEDAHRVPA